MHRIKRVCGGEPPFEGWSNRNKYVITRQGYVNPPRQGCYWTPKEDYDLIDAYTAGVPIPDICAKHQRSGGGICARMRDDMHYVDGVWEFEPSRAWLGMEQYLRETRRVS